MPPVLITCPITDDLIPAGVEVDDLVELESDNLLTACPVCGRDHGWTPADAVLAVASA